MMHPRIVLIDFDASRAVVAIEPSCPEVPASRVWDIVKVLSAAGMVDIEVTLDPRTTETDRDSVRMALRGTPATPRDGVSGAVEARGNCAFQRIPHDGAADARAASLYEACFDSLAGIVTRSAVVVAVVRAAAGMDPAIAGRLRFAVSELVANAADHAAFGAMPRVKLAIAASTANTLLVYRDNAAPFSPATPPAVDIARKIAAGERRGLGLLMLNRMAQQVRHRRHGEWNETTVLFLSAGSSPQPGRSSMDEFRLEQAPCRLPNTVVLKPIGSIDSTSVHVLDAKFAAMTSLSGVQIVVDMSSVTFLSSAGVGAFLGTVSQLRSTGGDLIFMDPPAAVTEVFEIINLSAYFRIVHSLDELQPAGQR